MAAELYRSGLPAPWNYGVTRDGRIFFINDESKSTTWLHPVYNHPVQSGNLSQQDLPKGCELAFTREGVPYYVDHTSLRTSFIHPVTGEYALPVHDVSQLSSPAANGQNKNFKRSSLRRSSKKSKIVAPEPKRSEGAPVTLRGWLYKQDSGGLRGWKRRWFILSDFCLYYYKGPEETQTQGSILLPSYTISFCHKDDGVNRKHSFKAEHDNMRTYYFAAENSDAQTRWMKALELATVLKRDPSVEYIEEVTHRSDLSDPSPSSRPEYRDQTAGRPDAWNPHDPRHDDSSRLDPRCDDTSPHNTRAPRPLDRPPPPPEHHQPVDTGGFGEPRGRPSVLDRPSPGGVDRPRPASDDVSINSSEGRPPLPDPLRRSSEDRGGFGDPRRRSSDGYNPLDSPSISPRDIDNMYAQVQPRRGHHDNRPTQDSMRRSDHHGDPGMRNTYVTREPSYPDPRPNTYNVQQPDRWADARYPDNHGNPQSGPGRHGDRDSMSSRGSYNQPPRDHNYNVPKASTGPREPKLGYDAPSNGYHAQYPSNSENTLERSADSLEKTLDRSFDSSQPLPGYDSFRRQQPPEQYRHGNQQPGAHGSGPAPLSRESSVSDIQRNNSLLRLQEWTRNQRNKPSSRPTSTYSNASERPISDGPRRYTGDSPHSSMHSQSRNSLPPTMDQSHGSMQQSMNQSQSPTQRDAILRSPPTDLKVDIRLAQGGAVEPDRPPIPAAYREQYIRELADTKTPHTRSDLLNSIEIQRLRQHEPLVFKYPEVRPPTHLDALGLDPPKQVQNQVSTEKLSSQAQTQQNQAQNQAPNQQHHAQNQAQNPRNQAPHVLKGNPDDSRPPQTQGTMQSIVTPPPPRQPQHEAPRVPSGQPTSAQPPSADRSHPRGNSQPQDAIKPRNLDSRDAPIMTSTLPRSQPQSDTANTDQERLRFEQQQSARLSSGRSELSQGVSMTTELPKKPQRTMDPSKSWDDLNDLDDDVENKLYVTSRIDQLLQEKRRIMGDVQGQGQEYPEHGNQGGQRSSAAWQSDTVYESYEERSPSLVYPDNYYEEVQGQGHGKVLGQGRSNHGDEQNIRGDEARDEFSGYEIPISLADRSDSMRVVPASRYLPPGGVPPRSPHSAVSPDQGRSVRRSLEATYQPPDNIYENTDTYRRAARNLYTKDPHRHNSQPNNSLSLSPADKPWQSPDQVTTRGQYSPHNYGNQYNINNKPPGDGRYGDRSGHLYVTQSAQDVRQPSHNNHGNLPHVSQSKRDVQYNSMPASNQYSPRHQNIGQSESAERRSQSLGNLHVDVGGWHDNAQASGDRQVETLPRQPSGSSQGPNGPSNLLVKQGSSQGSLPRQRGPPSFQRHAVDTIKEDPDMSDQDILTTKTLADLQRHLDGHRLRLSISANDLMGKSHEELVLLLIQLRRDQAKLERTRDYHRANLDIHRPQEKDYKIKRKNSIGRLHDAVEQEHDEYMEQRQMYEELEKQLEVTKPLVNLLDNMVRMGSLYGGDNQMMASQYKQHQLGPGEYTPPKKMITFTRQYQEDQLSKLQESELQQLMDDEVDLEEKLQQLYKLDRELQEKSITVTNLQENKDLLEKSVIQLRRDIQMEEDPHQHQRMTQHLQYLEQELATSRQELAHNSKLLEKTSAEDAKVENEVMLLRKRIYGLNRTQSTPSLANERSRTKQKLEQELDGVQKVMDGLSKQGVHLADTIKALRSSMPDLTAGGSSSSGKTYLETDLDTNRSQDLGSESIQRDARYTISPYSDGPHSLGPHSQGPHSEGPHSTQPEESQYASIRRDRPRNRAKSDPPPPREDSWRHDVDSTDVKIRVMDRDPEPLRGPEEVRDSRQVASEYASIRRDTTRTQATRDVRHDTHSQSYSSPRQPSPRQPSPQQPDQQDHREGLYRAEMRMVTPEPADHHRYQPTNQDTSSSNSDPYRDGPIQPHHYGNQGDEHTYRQTHGSGRYPYGKPTSEVHPQQQYVQRMEQPEYSKQQIEYKSYTTQPDYEPLELSEADENMKKFYGLLGKDASRSQTVREVKKEAERRSRERKRFYVNVHGPADLEEAAEFQRSKSLPRKALAPIFNTSANQSQDDSSIMRRKAVGVKQKSEVKSDRRVSASERLFSQKAPGGSSSSRDSVRRISDIYSPRPFPGGSTWQKERESSSGRQGGATIATVRPVMNTREQYTAETSNTRTFMATKEPAPAIRSHSSENLQLVREDPRVKEYWADRSRSRHTPRGRFMTISSGQPTQMESAPRWKPDKHQSAAGDLISGRWHDSIPDYIQSEPLKDVQIDSWTIDREVLFVPEKVDIPERYVPESDEEETPEDRERRLVKGEQIKRMLASQSLADWRKEEVGLNPRSASVHQQVEAERKRREHLLDLKHSLAIQVTQRSNQVAENNNKPQRPPYPEMSSYEPTPTSQHAYYPSNHPGNHLTNHPSNHYSNNVSQQETYRHGTSYIVSSTPVSAAYTVRTVPSYSGGETDTFTSHTTIGSLSPSPQHAEGATRRIRTIST